MKRLALFLDGTWNDPSSETNVIRMFERMADQDGHGIKQKYHYIKGVGLKAGERLRGGTLGKGLTQNVEAGYAWLAEKYDDGDEIYLFGFSRGAYTARSIAGMIARCGLCRRTGGAMSPKEIFAWYEKGKSRRGIYEIARAVAENQPINAEEQHLLNSSRRVNIKMIGVWDTVGAMGIPWTAAPFIGRGKYYFLNTNPSKIFEHAYHALAIDEHRGPYKATLWTRFTPNEATPEQIAKKAAEDAKQVIEQRWFVGAHCNVGGGYANDDLRKIPLEWIESKAVGLGLALKSRETLGGAEIDGDYTDSYSKFVKGLYKWVGSRFYRAIGAGPREVKGGTSMPVEEWVDASVFVKYRADKDYRPPNLEKAAAARGVSIAGHRDPEGLRLG